MASAGCAMIFVGELILSASNLFFSEQIRLIRIETKMDVLI